MGNGEDACGAGGIGVSAASSKPQKCDILLNNFQIKKKRYRVLLNYDHIVWERLDSNHERETTGVRRCSAHGLESSSSAESSEKVCRKVVEVESEQLSQRASSGSTINLVHIKEVIRVAKGSTKAQTLRLDSTNPTGVNSHHHHHNPPQPNSSTEQYLTIHYAGEVVKSSTDCNRLRVRTLTLYNSDTYIVRQWHAALTERLERLAPLKVRRLLVFINPYGGRRQALQTYERLCKPLFQLADIDASCIISQRANQIRDILMTHDLSSYDAVCCVGGDGTIAEVINGLIFRTILDLGLDMHRPQYIPKPRVPVGVIPAGSTDSIAYSLHGTDDVKTAAIYIILGQRRGIDVCSVRNRDGIIRFSTSVLSYGYLGDLAVDSEKYRWMGPKRYEYVGAKSFIRNRGYEVELCVLEEKEDQTAGVSTQLNVVADSMCYVDCQRCQAATPAKQSKEHVETESTANDCDKIDESVLRRYDSLAGDEQTETQNTFTHTLGSSSTVNIDQEQRNLPSWPTENATKDAKWKMIQGKYFMISSANLPCACRRAPRGIAPHCHLSDGLMHLILVRKSSILNNLRFAINSMGRNGDIRSLPFVEVLRTRQFSLRTPHYPCMDEYNVRGSTQPIAAPSSTNEPNDEHVSSWNCDGEILMDSNVTIISHCQLVDVFMRGPHEYNKSVRQNSQNSCLQKMCCCK